MNKNNFWYVVAESKELKKNQVLSRQVLGEWLAIFRDENNNPIALQDKCLHRSAQLSCGKVRDGKLQCMYHGWIYNREGEVIDIPSEGSLLKSKSKISKKYTTLEKDDYIYVRLCDNSKYNLKPFNMPFYKNPKYTTIRLQNWFNNNITNCAENFIDVPHTTFVHPKIFRSSTREKLKAHILREEGSVKIRYKNEKKNVGFFSFFLNSKKEEIYHTDLFVMPNITSVHYKFGSKKHFIITSQSIPVEDNRTLVYTDLTYNYGMASFISRPIVKRQAQIIINQDIEILNNQMKTIEKYNSKFSNSPCDIIHSWVESIQNEIENGNDPRDLRKLETEIEFWV